MVSLHRRKTTFCPEEWKDTARLFFDCVDFSDPSCDGWNFIYDVVARSKAVSDCRDTRFALLIWILEQFSQEMKADIFSHYSRR